MKTTYVPFGRLAELKTRPDANLLLTKPGNGIFDDYKVITFSTRQQLEEFNKRAGLKPLIYSEVPKGCAIYAHQREQVNH